MDEVSLWTKLLTMAYQIIAFSFVVLACFCVLVAALCPSSRFKGRTRLVGSMSIGAALCLGCLPQIVKDGRLWPGVVGVAGGIALGWLGLRKYQRDPEGKTA